MKDVDSSLEQAEAIPASAQAGLLTRIVFLSYMGQMLLNPIIAPLSREMGLREWHIGATISLSAVVLAASSTYWGRASQRLGVKRVMVTGVLIAAVSLCAFGVLSYLGMNALLTGTSLVVGVMFARGLLYGAGISAVAPTAQAHLVTHTATESGRVKAMGMIGAAQGMASIAGGVLGGGLAALGGMLLPLAVMPVVMGIGIVDLIVEFRPHNVERLIAQPKRIGFTDPRVRPWIIGGLCLFLVFSSVASVFGFTVQDRFALSGRETAALSALYLTVMGLTMIVGQVVIAPRTGWGAARLFRTGVLLLLVGVICLWPLASKVLLAIACILIGLGMGLAIPGYNTGPTLEMREDEQGAVAGVINANNGIAYAAAPVASTFLYGSNPFLVFIFAIAIAGAVAIYAFAHPALRK